jgi:hypothetical protein
VGRALSIVWSAWLVWRARAWLATVPLCLTAYLFALAVVSGFTIRSEGPQEPLMALVLALLGPSAIPRGRLPSVPLAFIVVNWPLAANALAAAALLLPIRRLITRIDGLPQFSPETHRLGRVVVSLSLLATFEGISAGTRALPLLLDWGAGGHVFGDPFR